MRRDRDRERIIGDCLKIGYKTDNVHFMDWNAVDWHLKDKGLPKLFTVLSTGDGSFGYIKIGGRQYEFQVLSYTKKKEWDVFVRQVKSGDVENGIPRGITAAKGAK